MKMLPGRIEHLPMSHRRHLHVGLETHVRDLFALLLHQLALESFGVLEEQVLGFRLRGLAGPLLLPRLEVSNLSF